MIILNITQIVRHQLPETLQEGVQDGPTDDGVCLVMAPAVDRSSIFVLIRLR